MLVRLLACLFERRLDFWSTRVHRRHYFVLDLLAAVGVFVELCGLLDLGIYTRMYGVGLPAIL